jgi:conjugative transfer region lipoprotein (TIGR03751 family)
MRILMAMLTVISTNLFLGCASKDSILPVPKDTMKTVYERHMQSAGSRKIHESRSLLRREMQEGDVALSEYVRTEKNQLQSKFRYLPNPTMYMFVAPHLATKDKVPVPGYVTEFKMWEKDQYALPGEVSDMSNGANKKNGTGDE